MMCTGGTFFSAIKCPMDKKSGDGKRDCQYLLPEPNPNPDNGISDAFGILLFDLNIRFIFTYIYKLAYACNF